MMRLGLSRKGQSLQKTKITVRCSALENDSNTSEQFGSRLRQREAVIPLSAGKLLSVQS
jgi:hypothetical protein